MDDPLSLFERRRMLALVFAFLGFDHLDGRMTACYNVGLYLGRRDIIRRDAPAAEKGKGRGSDERCAAREGTA